MSGAEIPSIPSTRIAAEARRRHDHQPVTVIAGQAETAALSGVRSIRRLRLHLRRAQRQHRQVLGQLAAAGQSGADPGHGRCHPSVANVASLTTGDDMACAALLDGGVICWGAGLLGDQHSEVGVPRPFRSP